MVPALSNTFRPSARLGLISLFTDVVYLSVLFLCFSLTTSLLVSLHGSPLVPHTSLWLFFFPLFLGGLARWLGTLRLFLSGYLCLGWDRLLSLSGPFTGASSCLGGCTSLVFRFFLL